MSTELNYKLNCSDYVLHDGDKPIGCILPEVAIVFDVENGTMYKHGSLEMVQKWFDKTIKAYISAGFNDMASNLTLICGRFQLDDLNRCLNTSGYALKLYRKIQDGSAEELPEFPKTESHNRNRDYPYSPNASLNSF